MSLTLGSRLGPYEIVALIGAGGMGEVYRALDTKLGRDVALKLLPDLFAEDPERLARFEREAKTLAALNHPNIAATYGLDRREGQEGQDGTTRPAPERRSGSRNPTRGWPDGKRFIGVVLAGQPQSPENAAAHS